jgi:hypothetical protein
VARRGDLRPYSLSRSAKATYTPLLARRGARRAYPPTIVQDVVAHLLDQQTRARGIAPPLVVPLPDDPRVRDLRVTPHALTGYDALGAPPTRKAPPDDDELPR